MIYRSILSLHCTINLEDVLVKISCASFNHFDIGAEMIVAYGKSW